LNKSVFAEQFPVDVDVDVDVDVEKAPFFCTCLQAIAVRLLIANTPL
jgi:hypothetical protein